MRIHSNTLTVANFGKALQASGLRADGVYIDGITCHGSRKRAGAFEIVVRATDGTDRHGKRRTWPNGGSHGAATGRGKAATYDEWGYLIAALYAIDPDAICGPYSGAENFHAVTSDRYEIKRRNTAFGHHFFDADTMEFFGSKVLPTVYVGSDLSYFVTSEKHQDDPRLYTVRSCDVRGDVQTVGSFQEHTTASDALAVARTLANPTEKAA